MPSSGLGMTVLYWSANLRKAQPGKAAKQRADMSWRTRNTCTCYHACQSPRDRQRSRSPQALTAVADGHLVVDEPATHTHTHTYTQYTHTHTHTTHTHTHTHTHTIHTHTIQTHTSKRIIKEMVFDFVLSGSSASTRGTRCASCFLASCCDLHSPRT
jgi:hypothetical protein